MGTPTIRELRSIARKTILAIGVDSPIDRLWPEVLAALQAIRSDDFRLEKGPPSAALGWETWHILLPFEGEWRLAQTLRALVIDARRSVRGESAPRAEDSETPRGPSVGGKARIIRKGEFPGGHA